MATRNAQRGLGSRHAVCCRCLTQTLQLLWHLSLRSRQTIRFVSCRGLLHTGCLCGRDTHLVPAACIGGCLRQLGSSLDSNQVWNLVPRAAKAALSIGYWSQHFSSSLFFSVATQGATRPSLLWRKHSLAKRHEPLSPLCQNRDHSEKQKIQFWWGVWGEF